jgi:hypothetical protein
MPKANWVATFYRADNDTSVAVYTEILITTVAAFTNYATTSAYITAPQKTKQVDNEVLTDLNGWEDGLFTLRDVFAVKLWPYNYTASATEPDLDDWETLIAWLKLRPKLWMSVNGGGRLYPSDVLKAHPIVIESVDVSVDAASVTHSVTLNIRVKGLL